MARLALLCLLAAASPAARAAGAEEGTDPRYHFEIAEPTLGAALEAIARVAGSNVLYPYELAAVTPISEVMGVYSLAQALELLLAGTGLSGQLTSGGVIVITAEAEAATTDGGSQMDQTDRKSRRGMFAGVAALLIGADAVTATAASAADEASNEVIENIVVTGVRGKPRSVLDSPIPIDVFSDELLQQVPQPGGLFQQLRYLVPSLNFPQRAGGGTATFIASAGLRGLNPDQTLVLVNGKRRHKTSLINTSTGLFSGSAGVDLNMIPNSAIERIEVLRDGAAAQYGSDAIAGVINIILKEQPEGGRLFAAAGENFDRDDGEFLNAGLNTGLALGENGFLNLSLDYRDRQGSERANPVPIPTEPGSGFRFFPDVDNGGGTFSVDPREGLVDRLVRNYGNYPADFYSASANVGYRIGDVELYSFATYAERSSTLFFTFRRPRDGRNNGELFPNGFIPEERIDETDFQVVAGVRGTTAGFDWDVSASTGTNEADWFNPLGANASLGEFSPTQFYLGAFETEEDVFQVDVTRGFDSGIGDLQVSFGAQYRREAFEIRAGDPKGTITYEGPDIVLPGDPRGAQGFPAFGPEDVNDETRHNVGIYGELGLQATDNIFLSAAARFEDYSDFGEESIFKLAGRWDPTPWLGVRASFNTGFRAPGIQQLGFRGTRGQFVDLDLDGVAETIVLRQTLPPTEAAADALGASPLQPETSTTFSAGVTITPGYGLTITLDAYQIDVEDRIVLSSQFNRGDGTPALGGGTIGNQVSLLLDAAGIDPSVEGVNYFTNSIDTSSRGVDLVLSYRNETDVGTFTINGAFNYNEVDIDRIASNPPELAGLVLADGQPLQQFDRARLGTYTDEFPETKLVLSSMYDYGRLGVTLRATQFGSFDNINNNPAADTSNDAEWIVDLEARYSLENGLMFTAGSNNIFNTYPDEVRAEGAFGGGQYDGNSPFGFTGGTWYLSAEYSW
ncbi:MAG: TonB-dependent receptor [Pseudomonadota bacterium]